MAKNNGNNAEAVLDQLPWAQTPGQGVEHAIVGRYTVVRFDHTTDFGKPSPDKKVRVASSAGFGIHSPGGVRSSLNSIKD